MSRLLRVGLCLAALALALPAGVRPALAESPIAVSGVVWFDDDRDGVMDSEEEPARDVTVDAFVGTWRPHGGQPTHVATVVSDVLGRFNLTLTPRPGEPAFVWARDTVRPGYPYFRPGLGPGPGLNYTSQMPPVPLDRGDRVTVDVPMTPLPGVLQRLPPGSPPDFPIPNGHFFTQTNRYVGAANYGFAVTNDDGIPFWDTWRRYGLSNVGYPVSHRLTWAGYTVQVFQKAILQWQPGRGVFFVNVFDEFHNAHPNNDKLLHDELGIPPQVDPSFDAGKSRGQIARDRLALLDADPAIRARYFASPDPLLLFGLPTSRVEDFGQVAVIRTQRAALQHWKVDVPFARAGEVTVVNGGDLAKERGLLWGLTWDVEAFIPRPAPGDRYPEARLR